MKTILVSIGLCLATTAVHAMPIQVLNANDSSSVTLVADQCYDRCESPRSYFKHRGGARGGYVLVRDPLIQRRPFCPFGSYVACVNSGAFCIDLCH